MATDTPRLSLLQPVGADTPAEYRESITQHATVLDNAALYLSGTLSSIPAASTVAAGTVFYATDVNILFFAVGSGASAGMWIQSMFSPGDLKSSAISTAPSGWLPCNGAPVSRTGYPFLYSAIGTSYGTGDGSTTFNVPDLRGRVPIGAGTGTAASASAWTLGQQPTSGRGGEETHLLSALESGVNGNGETSSETTYNESTSHTHAFSSGSGLVDVPITNNGAIAAGNSGSGSGGTQQGPVNNGGTWGSIAATQNEGSSHTHTIPNLPFVDRPADNAHNNVQPVSVVNWFIKA